MIVEEVLGDEFVQIKIVDFVLREEEKTRITCKIVFSNEWENNIIEGVGDGAIDALFTAMISEYSGQFLSLRKISFDDFIMQVKFKSNVRKSASPVEVKLALKNTKGNNIYFSFESQSVMKAAISVVTNACEYLINAERAIIQLRKDVKHALERGRDDLVRLYTSSMIDLVSITSYDEVL